MIVEPITVTVLNSYNLLDWEKHVIQRCIEDNPSSTSAELAVLLNISEKTFKTKVKEYNLKFERSGPESFINARKKGKYVA